MRKTLKRPYQNRKHTSTVDTQYFIVNHVPLKDITRLFSKITIHPQICWNGTPCWTWTGMIFKNSGYGRVGWGYRHTECTHRVMYAWLVNPIPYRVSGQKTPQLDHLCRNKLCCNPIHLELVSPIINIHRGRASQTHCRNGLHPYPEGATTCRICRLASRNKANKTFYEKHYPDPEYRKLSNQRARDGYNKRKTKPPLRPL